MERKARILVVDDDPAILAMVRQLLEKAGHRVKVATNTIGAGYLLGDFKPELVVLDIRLAGSQSGDQACETLRQYRPDILIVFYSGLDEQRLRELGARQKADAVLSKGSRTSELVETIERLLRRDGS